MANLTTFLISCKKHELRQVDSFLERLNIGRQSRSRFIINIISSYIKYMNKQSLTIKEIERRRCNNESLEGMDIPRCPLCSLESSVYEETKKEEA